MAKAAVKGAGKLTSQSRSHRASVPSSRQFPRGYQSYKKHIFTFALTNGATVLKKFQNELNENGKVTYTLVE